MSLPTPIRLSQNQARALHLSAQGLLAKPRRRATQSDLLAAIERMALLQIDTINVVARSPYLVLHSRVGDYRNEWLEQLLADGALFEVWAHEACFAPTADFVLHRSALDDRAHWSLRGAQRMVASHRADMDQMLAHVRERGAVKAADFERSSGKASSWWGWKDEKRWLEACFALGELMIARRESFQRVYDLPERVIGRHLTDFATTRIDAAAARKAMILRSVHALGITQARWIADYYRLAGRLKDADLDALVDDGELQRVDVAGWDAVAYVHRDHVDLARRAATGSVRPTHSTLLSPFDPLVWDRQRASVMFGFDYTLECYTPAPKRRYGYFTLPVLCRGKLVGRLDAKAHRKDGIFEVKVVHLEDGIVVDERLVDDVATAIGAAAQWHRTPEVQIVHSQPREFARMLTRRIAAS